MLSKSGRFLPPQAEEEEEEAAEGEHDAEDVDTVCRSIRPTISRRRTTAAPRSHKTEQRGREKRLAPEDGDARGGSGERSFGVLSWAGWCVRDPDTCGGKEKTDDKFGAKRSRCLLFRSMIVFSPLPLWGSACGSHEKAEHR